MNAAMEHLRQEWLRLKRAEARARQAYISNPSKKHMQERRAAKKARDRAKAALLAFADLLESSKLRQDVFMRDRGVCGTCGRGTEQLIETAMREDSCSREEAIRALGEFWTGRWNVKHLWHAEHTVPRAMGGSDELDNVTTMCICCHKTKTREQDLPRIRKSRRVRGKHQKHLERMAEKAGRV